MRILFMGTPDFALKSLKALYEAKYDIIGVVTNIDKPKGRGMKLVASPVKEYALEKGLPIYQPQKVRNNVEFLEEIKKIESRFNLRCSIWKNTSTRTVRHS